MREDTFIIQHALNQHFNLAAAGFTAKQAGRNNPGVIEHQQVAGVELIEQIGESAMRERARRPIQRQQTAAATLGLWIVSNQGFRQFKGEIGNAHGKKLRLKNRRLSLVAGRVPCNTFTLTMAVLSPYME
ncbi:hypothetical protein HMPREF0201_00816 [Cedecea davisae DSM 4568]|uniref:Uncharacterized protein n=1 Tax=Cedecea davisae DSM 4568 TaxID=566551 RepID=S3IZH8_9ENTR|nr:hypothetical protein HMPREF0201_00816 [Cedecea davisae DSM 4568]